MTRKRPENGIRARIASEAARILADQGYLSYAEARRKAARQLSCSNPRLMPDNREIEQALRAYQQLFNQGQSAQLQRLRNLALDAMRSLADYQPRLVGQVLSGSADQYSPIRINLFADTPEEVVFYLLERRIPWQETTVSRRYADGSSRQRPLLSFHAGETQIELLILPPLELRSPPISDLDGKPEKGASITTLEVLISTDSGDIDQRLSRGT